MATTAEHIAARNDTDLLARLIATAEIAGIPNAQAWVEQNRGALVSATINPDGTPTSIANIHAYTAANYEPRPRPGEDPAGVTDVYLAAAVQALRAEQHSGE